MPSGLFLNCVVSAKFFMNYFVLERITYDPAIVRSMRKNFNTNTKAICFFA